jgi:hypothetical protein
VNFRRTYEELEFAISFNDGGSGRVPGPTEWDIRLLAKVPKAPPKLEGFGWATAGDRIVGIDRKQRVVAYRNISL